MKNKLTIIFKKMAGICFFGMFVYIFIAKIFNLNEAFSILFFIGTFFFFGLMTFPSKKNMKFFSAWVLPAGLMFAAIGFSLLFIPAFILGETALSNTMIVGAIFFILAVLTILSTTFIGNEDYRPS